MINLLLIDDEPDFLKSFAHFLEEQGCLLTTCDSAESALMCLTESHFDSILLDVMMPDKNGIEFCKEISGKIDIPIILLSAKEDPESQILGLNYGAFSYISKADPRDLIWLKIKKIIDLHQQSKINPVLTFPPLVINLQKHTVTINHEPVYLTVIEFNLLNLIASKPFYIWPMKEIYQEIWGNRSSIDSQLVQTHMSRMRRKMESAYPQHDFIITIWGKGYQFNPKTH